MSGGHKTPPGTGRWLKRGPITLGFQSFTPSSPKSLRAWQIRASGNCLCQGTRLSEVESPDEHPRHVGRNGVSSTMAPVTLSLGLPFSLPLKKTGWQDWAWLWPCCHRTYLRNWGPPGQHKFTDHWGRRVKQTMNIKQRWETDTRIKPWLWISTSYCVSKTQEKNQKTTA